MCTSTMQESNAKGAQGKNDEEIESIEVGAQSCETKGNM
jgi:hypothetical protein